ncbi:MAG: class II fructose-bisphosphate aldolase [Thermomicrobiales bacterium]
MAAEQTEREHQSLDALLSDFRKYGTIEEEGVGINDADGLREHLIDKLVFDAVFGDKDVMAVSRWLIWETAQTLGTGPASIHEYYMAGGQGAWSNRTTPAINIRGITYEVARTIFKARKQLDVGQQIFEIARSEIGYTEQRPEEYATVILAAAIKEGHEGPVFIQGDHFQISLSDYRKDEEKEVRAVEELAKEAIDAGFYNIDVDASTIVDLSLDGETEQQRDNARRTAEITRFIRENQPDGIMVSVGGEIGEVGSENSTVAELVAFMEHFNGFMEGDTNSGLSKISVQTGTSHGGVPLPDGTVADVAVDFKTLGDLSEVARDRFSIAGAVQHGASTLPDEAFNLFAEANACEVHLATGFQNIIFESESLPEDLRQATYDWLSANRAQERKDGETDAQFFYKTRKRAFGPFKRYFWTLEDDRLKAICDELEERFVLMFELLGVSNTSDDIRKHTTMVTIHQPQPSALEKLLVSGD